MYEDRPVNYEENDFEKSLKEEILAQRREDRYVESRIGLGKDGPNPEREISLDEFVEKHRGVMRHRADLIVNTIKGCWLQNLSGTQEVALKSMVLRVLDYLDYIPMVTCRYGDYLFLIDDCYVACFNDKKICDYGKFVTVNYHQDVMMKKHPNKLGVPVDILDMIDDYHYVWFDDGISDHIGVVYNFTGNFHALHDRNSPFKSDGLSSFVMLFSNRGVVFARSEGALRRKYSAYERKDPFDKVVCKITPNGETYKDEYEGPVLKTFNMDVEHAVEFYSSHLVAILEACSNYCPVRNKLERDQGWRVFGIFNDDQLFVKNFEE